MTSTSTGRARPAPTILCAGIAVEDLLFKVERFPKPGEKIGAEALVTTTGGCAANAAVAIARLGGTARFAGPLGTDEASGRLIDNLGRMGIDTGGVMRIESGSIPVSAILIDHDGEKMVATRHGERLDGVAPHDPDALVADIDLVLADNRFPDFVRPICQAARSCGVPVILDGDKVMKLEDSLFNLACFVIFSSEALRATTGISDLDSALRRAAARIHGFLAVTNGPDDVLWMDAGTVRRMPVFKVDAVDTLAAGDVFHGGFALAVAEGRDTADAMRIAAAASAIKCTRFGGISGSPSQAELKTFLAAQTSGLK